MSCAAAGSAEAACAVDPDADNESDSDGDEDWQYIKVEPSKEEPCEQLLPQHQAEQLPLPVDPEEEKQDEPKPVPEEEPALQQPIEEKPLDANQLGQLNDDFELSAEVERKLTLEETDQFELKFSENTVEENAFTSEVKFTVGDLTPETSEFENLTKPQAEEQTLQQFATEEALFETKLSLAEETQKEEPKQRPEGRHVPSNLDLEVIDTFFSQSSFKYIGDFETGVVNNYYQNTTMTG